MSYLRVGLESKQEIHFSYTYSLYAQKMIFFFFVPLLLISTRHMIDWNSVFKNSHLGVQRLGFHCPVWGHILVILAFRRLSSAMQ